MSLHQAAPAPAFRDHRGSLRRVSRRSRSYASGSVRLGLSPIRAAPTGRGTSHRQAVKTTPRARGHCGRLRTHPPCSRRSHRAGRPESQDSSWDQLRDGRQKDSLSTSKPVIEMTANSHSGNAMTDQTRDFSTQGERVLACLKMQSKRGAAGCRR